MPSSLFFTFSANAGDAALENLWHAIHALPLEKERERERERERE